MSYTVRVSKIDEGTINVLEAALLLKAIILSGFVCYTFIAINSFYRLDFS